MATSYNANGEALGNWAPAQEGPAFQPRKLRVVCIGAGFAGLMLSYQHKHGDTPLDRFMDLRIYEKNDDVGGTWLVNKYPGVACDVPAQIYTFPFEPNPSWSRFYASGPEIWSYIKRTSEKYQLDEPVIFNSQVTSSVWDDEAGKWRLEIQQGLDTIKDEADILVNATGFLSKWTWPAIPGLDKFKGKLVHTAAWDTNLDWSGKKVAIIGNGSSAVQLLPEMQPAAAKIVNYVRGPLWISSAFAAEFTPEGKNFAYTDKEIQAFKDNPEKFFQLRHSIEHSFNKFFRVSIKDSPEQAGAFQHFKAKMEEVLNHDPYLCAKLIPTFQVGCRRLSPGENYLQALQEENVTLEFDPIQGFTESGIHSLSKTEDFDIIICATGFDVSFRPGWKVVGKNGISLAEQWRDVPEAYFGVWAANMPNFLTVNGPNTPLAHGSLLAVMSFTVDYISRWIRKISTQNIKSILVRQDALNDYNVYVQELLKTTVWTGDCRSWFKNGKVDGRVTAMYPGSVIHFKEMLDEFRTEDFEYEHTTKNRFQFMGNGMTFREKNDEDLAWYMRK
ncbi:monooxygenase [Fusarium beomiforme]|uniref:Monooxygenase n=1 Tax=Fusarium beomiforme TaxID=44412 RepID=A0A9P5A425_9HYPO|nr:monooxygenase [Fusarium beomiforme]